MFLKNKKFIISLFILTLLGGIVISQQKKKTNNMSEEDLTVFSQQFNKDLPVRITEHTTLIKTQIGTVSPTLFSLDFFYSYYMNKKDIQNFDKLTENMIYQTCNNPTMLSLLQQKVLIRHQYISLDKEKLPYIGVSLSDCVKKGAK